MRVSLRELLDAVEFVSFGNEAFLCKQSGRIYLHAEDLDDLEEVPDDIEDEKKYLPIPDKRELDLGKRLVLDFAHQFLPNHVSEVHRIFSKRGAYANFRQLLSRTRTLDQWYEFEAKAQERELRSWCEVNSIELTD
jgi:hypothetical protein